ncbi:unnamed protein product [Paramecium pentaurelia]|uniref:Uncharacterized protein n=1 Tax=Paramecium pentaurelia TaxID=43138 RepID=A0A8S1TXB6_9CILI|nr:unnamed protein product [Paramecium pentaurelia]
MNQFSNYLLQYQTKKVFSIYQHQYNSKSPQVRKQFHTNINPKCSPKEQKQITQFKCQDYQLKNQLQPIILSPSTQKTNNTNKIKGKENNNNQLNVNNIFQPSITSIQLKSPQNFRQNPYNVKQPTPEFQSKQQTQVLRLSNSRLNFRFVISKQESQEQDSNIEYLNQQVNYESSQQSPIDFSKNDDLLCDSFRKSRSFNIQAFDSTELEKTYNQQNNIIGSSKNDIINKKKFSQPTIQTEGTQRTMEDDSIIKVQTMKQVKTIGGYQNIDIQSMQLRTEFTDIDSQRSKSTFCDERVRNCSSFRNNVVTPRKMQQNQISFLMYKNRLERKQ